MSDDAATAWVREKAKAVVEHGIGEDANLFLNALALAAGEIIKLQFAPADAEAVAANLGEQIRRIAVGQGRPQ